MLESLTRKATFEALKQRRCYGTTGARMHLDFTVDGHVMGEVIDAGRPMLRAEASVIGCGPIERLTLHHGREVVHEVRPPAFESLKGSRRIRIAWAGSRIRGRGRRVTWDGALRSEGCRIMEADLYSFDSPGDGITQMTDHSVQFVSRTTGDVNGLDLVLVDASKGTLTLDTAVGPWTVDLPGLGGDSPVTRMFGGVDMRAWVERYPELVDATELSMILDLPAPQRGRSAYFVKAVQCDGHTAWSSPIYIGSAASDARAVGSSEQIDGLFSMKPGFKADSAGWFRFSSRARTPGGSCLVAWSHLTCRGESQF